MSQVDWQALLEALVCVEELAAGQAGMLLFGAREGCIFVEDRRICWAAAQGLESRLRDLLRPRLGLDDAELDHIYDESRRAGQPFGQHGVARGLIEPRELEHALRRHSAESLVKLCDSPKPLRWTPRVGHGYAPRFTFPSLVTLFDVTELVLPGLRAAALDELAPVLGAGRRATSFYYDAALDLAVPLAAERYPTSLAATCELGRWAACLPRATRELAAAPSFTLATNSDGSTSCVWWHDSLLHVCVCDDLASLAIVTAHHLARA